VSDDPILRVITAASHPAVTTVLCYSSTAAKIEQKHPEVFAGGKDLGVIERGVVQADAVYPGNVPESTFVYVCSNIEYEGHPLVTTVKVVEGTSARWTSSYHTSSFAARAPIWKAESGE
jgi:hypothetical protein